MKLPKGLISLFGGEAPTAANQGKTDWPTVPGSEAALAGIAPRVGYLYSALQGNPTVRACIEIIASSLAGLPMREVQGEHDERVAGSKITDLLAYPCAGKDSGYTFWEDTVTRFCIEGNAFAALWKDPETGAPFQILPAIVEYVYWMDNGDAIYQTLLRDRRAVEDMRARGVEVSIPSGSVTGVRYANTYTKDASQDQYLYRINLRAKDLLHFKFGGRAFVDSPFAPSPAVTLLPMLRGWAAAAEYRNKLKRGKNPKGFMSFPEAPDAQYIEDSFKQWVKLMSKNESGVTPLPFGAEWVEAGMSIADQQLIDDLKYDDINCTKVYRVPLYMLNIFERNMGRSDTAVAGQGENFVKYTLLRHIHAMQAELDLKLGLARTDRRILFDTTRLLRGSTRETTDSLKQVQLGGLTANEWRRKYTDLPDHPDGNVLYPPAGAGDKAGNDEPPDQPSE